MLLPAMARIFGAELGFSSYGEHQAVMDLLAKHCDAVLSPLNITLTDFLVLYRDANELARIPTPTVLNNIFGVIDDLNGPRPGKDASHRQQPLAATTAAVEGIDNLQAPAVHEFQATTLRDEEQTVAAAATPPPRQFNYKIGGEESLHEE